MLRGFIRKDEPKWVQELREEAMLWYTWVQEQKEREARKKAKEKEADENQ